MKTNISKIISLLLVFILVCPLVNVTAFAEDTHTIDTYSYNLLKGLGATNEGIDTSNENATVTRAQYAYMLSKLMGYKDQPINEENPFKDVEDGIYSGGIYYLRSMGIINGVSADKFDPDGYVSLEAAYVMSLRAMDYDDIINLKYGNNKNAIILMAKDAKIDEGVSVTNTNAITVGEACDILANTATKPVLYQVSFGDETEYNRKSYSILSVYSDIVYAEGIMTNNGITTLGDNPVSNGRVVIGGIELTNKSFMGAKDLLGKNVEFFFTKDKKELIYAQPFNNTIIQIDADDLVPGSTTINNISYYTESGKQKNESLMLTTKMIYNGFQHPYYTADDIKITDGMVTLIDNDNDGDFEVVCVDEYVDYEVTGATDKAVVTTDKAIEYEQYKNVYFFDENGNSITYDKVASGSTATVCESKDKNMLSIYFISNSINGILNKVAQDESGITTYQIGDKYYELTTSLENKIESGKVLPLDIGTGYVCKLNIFGEIVSFEKIETSDWKDAYCVGLAHPNKSGIDSKVQVNLVMLGGSVFKPYLSNKILFNGESKKATELVGSSYFEDVSGTPLRQPVKVKINNNGEITAMQVPEDKTMTTYGVDFGVFSYDKYLASGHYRGNNNYKTINNHVLTSKTIIVEDPHYKVDGEEGETEGVVFYTMDLFPIEVTLNDIRFYDLDEGLRPGVMVYKSKNITIQGTPFLVDSVISVLNEEGDKIKRITGYSNGAFLTYDEIEQGVIPTNIKRGDVCKIALDGTKLAVIERVMSLKDRKPYADTTVINAKTCYVYSYLYSVTDTSLVVTAPESYTDSKLIGSSMGAAKIIVYDLTADKMYLGTAKDLYTDFVPDSQGEYSVTDASTMVFIHRSYDRAGDIIVVKK